MVENPVLLIHSALREIKSIADEIDRISFRAGKEVAESNFFTSYLYLSETREQLIPANQVLIKALEALPK